MSPGNPKPPTNTAVSILITGIVPKAKAGAAPRHSARPPLVPVCGGPTRRFAGPFDLLPDPPADASEVFSAPVGPTVRWLPIFFVRITHAVPIPALCFDEPSNKGGLFPAIYPNGAKMALGWPVGSKWDRLHSTLGRYKKGHRLRTCSTAPACRTRAPGQGGTKAWLPQGQGCVRREGTSEAAPEAVSQAVGGGCRSGWGQLLSVTNAIEAGTWGQWLGIGWAPWEGGGVHLHPLPMHPCPGQDPRGRTRFQLPTRTMPPDGEHFSGAGGLC